jgi:hypothetical protein
MCEYLKSLRLRQYGRLWSELEKRPEGEKYLRCLMERKGFSESQIESVINTSPLANWKEARAEAKNWKDELDRRTFGQSQYLKQERQNPSVVEKYEERIKEAESELMDAKKAYFERLRPHVLAMEQMLIDGVYADEITQQTLKGVGAYLDWRATCRNITKEALKEEWKETQNAKERWKGELESPLVGENLTLNRKAWMELMEELCGTHFPGRDKDYRPISHRHDARDGAYGQEPVSHDDCDNTEQTVLVIHGHGGWYRPALLSHCQLSLIPGLTSLRAVMDQVRSRRIRKKLVPLDAKNVTLAFVSHHGGTALGDGVKGGAYPTKVPLSLKWKERVEELVRSAEAAETSVDDYFKKRYRVTKKEKGQSRLVFKNDDAKHLSETYTRFRQDNGVAQHGEYVDIIRGESDLDVPFPDPELGPLGTLQDFYHQMKPWEYEHYKIYTNDFGELRALYSNERGNKWLSNVLIHRVRRSSKRFQAVRKAATR